MSSPHVDGFLCCRCNRPARSVRISRIVLVRHGETIWHAENRYAGRTDIALTPRGFSQAIQLAGWAASADISAVWCSPLSRSRLTTQPSADAVHLPLQTDSRLVEPDFGYGEGLIDQEMHERLTKARAVFMQDPAANFLPGGDDPVHAAQRGTEALRDIASFAGPRLARSCRRTQYLASHRPLRAIADSHLALP